MNLGGQEAPTPDLSVVAVAAAASGETFKGPSRREVMPRPDKNPLPREHFATLRTLT
jgi:hypothetical protein